MYLVPDIFYSLNLNTIHAHIVCLFTNHFILIIKNLRIIGNELAISCTMHLRGTFQSEVHSEVQSCVFHSEKSLFFPGKCCKVQKMHTVSVNATDL